MGLLQAEDAVTGPLLVVRPGRGDTGLILAEAHGGRLRVAARADIDLPSLAPAGEPSRATSAVIAGLLGELPAPPREARLVLPPGMVPLRRVEVALPIRGAVDQALIAEALARARTALGDEGRTAVLACRPAGYAVDGAWGEGDPTGARGRELLVEATALCVPLALLARFERALGGAGLTLDGVMAPAEALLAACLPGGEGMAVRVGHGATLAISARAGGVTHQASVPLGRRHLEQDVGEACALEPAAAREAVAAVLGGDGATVARRAVEARLGELRQLLDAARTEAGFPAGDGVTLSGVPPEALSGDGAAACDETDDPLLIGGARLALGLAGEVDQPALQGGGAGRGVVGSAFGWLRARF